MAEPVATEVAETERENPSTTQEMELETPNPAESADNGGLKRGREEENEAEEEGGEKKQKVEDDKSAEEKRLEEGSEPGEAVGAENGSGPVTLGPKSFGSSVEMFDYFFKFLHYWTPNLDVNKYEHTLLLELLQKGHLEPEEKIGTGIQAFQVRYHPEWNSRCYFLIRDDASIDDFSFRKCVHQILPLPENMLAKADVNKALGGGGRGGGRGGRGGGRGRGRGGWRGGKRN